MVSDSREATIILHIEEATAYIVNGRVRNEVCKAPFMMLGFQVTEQESKLMEDFQVSFKNTSSELVFLVCGEHKVPLLPNVPIIKMDHRFYVCVLPGLFLGFDFSTKIAMDELETMEILLAEYGNFRNRLQFDKQIPSDTPITTFATTTTIPPPTAPDLRTSRTAERISTALISGGEKISAAIDFGAYGISQAIMYGGNVCVSKLTPNDQDMSVSPKLVSTLKGIKYVSSGAVRISASVANKLMTAAMAVGRTIGNQIDKRETGTLGRDIKEVAVSGIHAGNEVLVHLTDASKGLAKLSGEEVAKVVTHKYGEEAGKAAGVSTGVFVDAFNVALNVRSMGARCLAKATAKQTLKTAFSSS